MYIKSLHLKNFRNFTEKRFDFPDSVIVFEGHNGIGKTNILESIYFLCTGKSQRKAKKKEMLQHDKTFFLSKAVSNMKI